MPGLISDGKWLLGDTDSLHYQHQSSDRSECRTLGKCKWFGMILFDIHWVVYLIVLSWGLWYCQFDIYSDMLCPTNGHCAQSKSCYRSICYYKWYFTYHHIGYFSTLSAAHTNISDIFCICMFKQTINYLHISNKFPFRTDYDSHILFDIARYRVQ